MLNFKNHNIRNALIILLITATTGCFDISLAVSVPEKGERTDSFNNLTLPSDSTPDNIFIVYSPSHEIRGFKSFASQMSRLRGFGRIDVIINFTTDKAIFEMPEGEDTFLPGPDLINPLKQKRKIMLDHWQDIEDYLTSPFK